MRIFVAGATGALGRALLPLLTEHSVLGMTRSRADLVVSLGAEPVVCDVYDRERLFDVVASARPQVVVDLLTDLADWDYVANARIRRQGTAHLVDAALAAGAQQLVLESVDFPMAPAGAEAVSEMEVIALASGLRVEIVHLGRLWGPHTGHNERPAGAGWLHVDEAAVALRTATTRAAVELAGPREGHVSALGKASWPQPDGGSRHEIGSDLGFLLGEHAGWQVVAPSAWADATPAKTQSWGEVLLDGIAVKHHHVSRRETGDVFETVNFFLRPPGASLLLYGFDTLGYPPEPPAVGTWNGGRLMFERTTTRGDSRTLFLPTPGGYRWSTEFRSPGNETWQPVFEEVLHAVAQP
jgi:hypothetical protein